MDANQWNGSDPGVGLERAPDEWPCDICGKLRYEDDLIHTIWDGYYCSDECAVQGEAEFTEHMQRNGWMKVQPDLLIHEKD